MRGITTAEFSCGDVNFGERDDRFVLALKSYFDDSSDSKNERYSAVGGLIGSSDQWQDFELQWAPATFDLKEPFRSTECESQHGQFRDWDKHKCDALMKQLVGLVYSCQLHGFGSIVPIADYKAIFPDCDEYDPYILALKHTIINMAVIGAMQVFEGSGPVGIKIWHEDSKTTGARAYQAYADLKALDKWDKAHALSGFAVSDKRLMPLQAADLMAREAFKHADNLGVRRIRKPVKALKDRTSFHLWTPECLEYLKDNGGPTNLETLIFWGQRGGKVPQMINLYRDGFTVKTPPNRRSVS